jgi:hypothetical protein
MNEERSDVFYKLSALGAGDFVHLNGSLETHLIAVFNLLQEWSANDTLCRAGLYHAAYGTSGFDQAMVSLQRRDEIASLIGLDSEAIVYTYCACDRGIVWPQIGDGQAVNFVDRFATTEHAFEGQPLREFCELTCANELELAISDPEFADRSRTYLGPLFRRWTAFLSPPARQAVRKIYPET